MHLATEVSSTTNHQMSSMDATKTNNSNNNNSNGTSNSNNDTTKNTTSSGYITAENLAERTIDSLLAEHPGELVRTGSPHIVIYLYPFKIRFLMF